jgi:hypothetical protein
MSEELEVYTVYLQEDGTLEVFINGDVNFLTIDEFKKLMEDTVEEHKRGT